MTSELLATTTTSSTLYALLFDATGNVWNGSTFETPANANWATYDIAMTEAGTTGIYRGTMPAVAAGAYSWLVYKQAGASPAVGDTVIGSGTIRWTGTTEETVPASANVTHHAGVAVAAADLSGNVPVIVKAWYDTLVPEPDTAGYPDIGTVTNISLQVSQQVRDAMKLAPSAGAPAAGSVDDLLGDVSIDPQAVRDAMLLAPTPPGTAAAGSVDALLGDGLDALEASLLAGLSGATVTVVAAVDGGRVTVYAADTWRFTVASDALEALGLTDYEVLGLVVKRDARQTDSQALLYLRTDTGLARIDGAAPASAANGALTASSGSFSGVVHVAETAGVGPGSYTWWLKGLDTTPAPDEAVTLATGRFVVLPAGLQAVV